jgi:hypothetical protein
MNLNGYNTFGYHKPNIFDLLRPSVHVDDNIVLFLTIFTICSNVFNKNINFLK